MVKRAVVTTCLILLFLITPLASTGEQNDRENTRDLVPDKKPEGIVSELYNPLDKTPLNIKESMTLSPMFTPDNALLIHANWLSKATTSIDIQNQYIYNFSSSDWSVDENPIVRELVDAAENRNVDVRVQVRGDSDKYNVADYLNQFTNIEVRYMGTSLDSNSDADGWLSLTHNKLVIIDSSVTLISSINFVLEAFTENREAGMVVQSSTVADYFGKFFDEDWGDGEILKTSSQLNVEQSTIPTHSETDALTGFTSHTNIPRTNFTGTYNVSAYVNPDNADQHIFKYLESAKESIYVSMYTISRPAFVDTLIDLKQSNPSIDIQVLISYRRVGKDENIDTREAIERLTDALIPVYNSTKDNDKVDRFYHNKYWIVDQKHTFVYSGNWSPKSVTPVESDDEYSSSTPNRDMGIAVHDNSEIANFFKTEVWDKDVAVGEAFELPVGITQNSFSQADVVSGEVNLAATVSGLNDTTVSYRFGGTSFTEIELSNNAFAIDVDTTNLDNGVTKFEVKAVTSSQTFTDEVTVTIANYPSSDNWRFLITEIHPDPESSVGSDAEAEFFELTNSFPFDVYLEGWQTGDDGDLYTFDEGYSIDAYSSIIFAKDSSGFETGFGVIADIEHSFSLTNGGDYIQLLDASGEFIDFVAFGDESALDDSVSISAPDAGQSINRDPLHIDTNTASDFTIGTPTPKAEVPEVTLGAVGEDNTDLSDLSFYSWYLVVFVLVPVIGRKRK